MARTTKEEREAKRDREVEILKELETDHGYMFAEIEEEDDRRTMHFSGSRETGKYALVAARVLRVSMPEDSWLARWANAQEEEAREAKLAKKSAKSAKLAKVNDGIRPGGRRRATAGHARRGRSNT